MNEVKHKKNITTEQRAIREAYNRHKSRCDSKNFDRQGNNVKFLLTLDEWWAIWEASGKFAQRGRCRGQYVMSRKDDVGPYALGNVFIQTHGDNVREAKRIQAQERRAQVAKHR